MKVLQITVHLFPNVGGVETHLSDLFDSLIKSGWKIFVLAYQPLSTKIEWKMFSKSKDLIILRIPWLRGFFEKLVSYPILEFIYLVSGLFIVCPFVIAMFRPQVLHAHGLVASVSAVFWGKIFKLRTIISLHSYYTFPKKGLYRSFVKFLLSNADFVLSLSEKSNSEIRSLGLSKEKLGIFTYWIDLEKFKRVDNAKKQLGWEDKFVILFVGRLIKEKGLDVLLNAAKNWNKNIQLVIIGSGPMEEEISRVSKNGQVKFIGRKSQEDLPIYYSAADFLIVPSTSEEGFGRVIIEALACGTPVIGAKRGAISEAMDETVGKLIDVTEDNIKNAVEYFSNNQKEIKKLSQHARQFAERRYSEKNAESIIKIYTA
ncbi:MAG: glycosyltransferase family 4 protein [Actinobacteria bacterium]|nr:glycosyltransferase family 4 protein [Actinomycetota bacterium]